MKTRIFREKNVNIAEVISKELEIQTVQDVLDLIANVDYEGARNIIVHETIFAPEFYDLKTRIAGEILQKVAQYNIKLAIVGEFEKYESKSLNAFIVESNRGKNIFFVPDIHSAIQKLIL